MAEDYREYYDAELRYLRKMGADFRDKYPGVGERLTLDEKGPADPHTERLLEGVAFLSARVQMRIDEDFPEITSALLSLVYPHYLRPAPACSLVQFRPDPAQGKMTSGLRLPQGSMLNARARVRGAQCSFRTCSPVSLWPLEVAAAEWKHPDRVGLSNLAGGAAAVLRLELACLDEAQLSSLDLDSLRFYLDGPGELAQALYEILMNNCAEVFVRDPNAKRTLPARLASGCLQAAGFEEQEALLPYLRRSFDGYRLLQEYFIFPRKFHFIELSGLRAEFGKRQHSRLEIFFVIKPFERENRWQMLEAGVNANTLRLGCTPIVNLFRKVAEPIALKQTQHEYLISPDTNARRAEQLDIFSVDEVLFAAKESSEIIQFDPLYSFRHDEQPGEARAYWFAARRQTLWRTEQAARMYLSFMDLSGRPKLPHRDSVTCVLTCTNRDLPSELPIGNPIGDFELAGGGPQIKVAGLTQATPSYPPPARKALLWRLVSHLSLNYLSLVGDSAALKEILRLYDFKNSTETTRQIEGILSVTSRPHVARVSSPHGIGFARGTRVEIELDEEHFSGGGVFLFASVLERFLASYVSLNSFSQLEARVRQRREALRQWEPRAGRRILV